MPKISYDSIAAGAAEGVRLIEDLLVEGPGDVRLGRTLVESTRTPADGII